jgi:FAD binding domain
MPTFSENINGQRVVKVVDDTNTDIELIGQIADNANVKFVSKSRSVPIQGPISGNAELLAIAGLDILFQKDLIGNSSSKLISNNGNVSTGGVIFRNDMNITDNAKLSIVANKNVEISCELLAGACNVSIISKRGSTRIDGSIADIAKLYIISEGDIEISGNIGISTNPLKHGSPQVELISTQGSIKIRGGIIHNSSVRLTAAKDILIEDGINKGADGLFHPSSSVVARCEGTITVNKTIQVKSFGYIEFRAHKGIRVEGDIVMADFAKVKLITISGGVIINGNLIGLANLKYWPANGLVLPGAVTHPLAVPFDRADKDVTEFKRSTEPPIIGSWWNNWMWSYGFVSDQIFKPKTYTELVNIMNGLADQSNIRVKGVGGGWSFTDAALPQNTVEEVDNVSIFERGKNNTNDLINMFADIQVRDTPMDMYPFQVAKSLEHSSAYDDNLLKKKVKSGIDLKSTPSSFKMIDTRNVCSSLQFHLVRLKKHIVDNPDKTKSHRYWVEAGITMSDLQDLLDHNLPRLAMEASGGSPGATLAGTISTATHGGEFKKPLLVDRILAVHLIGPDGTQWWIQGKNEVFTEAEFNTIDEYRGQGIRFVFKEWDMKGVNADDFLKSVVTSMGAIGIIYSVVLEVVPQFSVQQSTYKYSANYKSENNGWLELLKKAGITHEKLVKRDTAAEKAIAIAANNTLLDFLKDGSLNGTGISAADNQYVDLAINPISKSCWIVNRKFLPLIADDNKEMDLMSNYINSLSGSLVEGVVPGVAGKLLERIGSFLGQPTNLFNLAFSEIFGTGGFKIFTNFLNGVQGNSMLLSSILAHLQIKAKWNTTNVSNDPLRGHEFLGDLLEGVLDALQGTHEEPKAVFSGLSSQVGAIGWPNTGIPGRGYEVALPPDIAFSYVAEILDRIDNYKDINGKKQVFLGYISVRLCPPTKTLMGMQQFSPFSVMVEVVGHRTPEANDIFDNLINYTIRPRRLLRNRAIIGFGFQPPFHWGFETDKIDKVYLELTEYNKPYRGTKTKLDVFKFVKDFIRNSHEPIFDNNFVKRMGL